MRLISTEKKCMYILIYTIIKLRHKKNWRMKQKERKKERKVINVGLMLTIARTW